MNFVAIQRPQSQQVFSICLKPKHQKIGGFGEAPESALGAGGRAFESFAIVCTMARAEPIIDGDIQRR
jgi:hypothetical protein